MPIDKLVPWDRNPRKGHDVAGIGKSIENFGYLDPIVAQKSTLRVLSGHGRLKALKDQGVAAVPVILADLDDKQAAAFTIAANKLGDKSKFDFGDLGHIFIEMGGDFAQLTGFSEAEIVDLSKIAHDIDDAIAVAADAQKATLYAGQSAVKNDNTLVVVFDNHEQLKVVKAEIRKRQSGNDKSIGQVVFEEFA